MGRSPCCTEEGLNRGAWAASEDKILEAYIKAHGEGKWRNLPKKAGLKRCGKSCRLRWLNYLRPDIKRGNISHDEEDLIIRLHKLLGNRWSLIAGRLPGRTDNEIKNYWNTTLGKKANAQSSASPQSKQTSPSKCTSKKLASGPTATEHSASSPQAAPAIRTKATRCTKVVLSLESPPAALPTTDPPTPTIPSTDQPQASSLSATTDFHTCPRGPQLLNFDCPDFQASDRGVQVDDDDYHQNLYVQQQPLPLDEPVLKGWTTGTSLEDNAGLDLDSLASFLDISEEWDILKFSSKFL